MAKLASWSKLKKEYPDDWRYSSARVKKDIGGNVDESWITNTCVVRLSRALNYTGIPIPQHRAGDGKRYAIRVREINRCWCANSASSSLTTPRKRWTLSTRPRSHP